jgi:epoxyqueuosine reductase QueG
LFVPKNEARWLRRNALVAAGNVGTGGLRASVDAYAHSDDEMLAETATWALGRMAERGA